MTQSPALRDRPHDLSTPPWPPGRDGSARWHRGGGQFSEPPIPAGYAPIALLIRFAILGTAAGFVSVDVIEPGEFDKEVRSIENEIEFTDRSCAPGRIVDQDVLVSDSLSLEQVDATPRAVETWGRGNPRPPDDGHRTADVRTGDEFAPVDIDRHEADGPDGEVIVSGRELAVDALPQKSRTWVNPHPVCTHGYGLPISPLRTVSAEGPAEVFSHGRSPDHDGRHRCRPAAYRHR